MNQDRQTFAGCAIWIGIAMLIGAGFRSKTIAQFFVMAVIMVFGLLALYWALANYSKGSWGNTLFALLYTYIAAMLLLAGGNFLKTGDYNKSLGMVWKQTSPTSTAMVKSESTPVPTQTAIIANATMPSPTSETSNGFASQWSIPPAVQTIWNKLSADTTSSQPISEQFENWRLVIGIILGLQYVAGFYVAKRTRQRSVGRNFIFYGAINILLMFTKLGQWLYGFYMLIAGWGVWGYIIIAVLIILLGIFGFIISMMGFNNTIGSILIGTICGYIIASFMYHNVQMLQFCVLPLIVMISIVLYFAIYQAKYRRYIKFT